jgi:hypothetical protein
MELAATEVGAVQLPMLEEGKCHLKLDHAVSNDSLGSICEKTKMQRCSQDLMLPSDYDLG